MKRNLYFKMVAILLASVGWIATAQGAIIGFSSDTLNFSGEGDDQSVDVIVSNLGGDIVAAYDLDILFDSSVASVTDVSFGIELGEVDWFEVLEDWLIDGPGLLEVAALSFLSDAELFGLQNGDSVRLFTISFAGLMEGSTGLSFDFSGAGKDVKGANNRVIIPTVSVPEPSTAYLMGLGVVLLALRRGRRGFRASS